jgi:lipoprotein
MKTRNLLYLLLSLGIFSGCTPKEGEVLDFSNFEIEKVELSADHESLIADGVATLTLNPMLYQTVEGKDGEVYGRIPTDRISGDMVKYFLEDGTELEGPEYRTTDASKGEVKFYIMANGMKSNLFTVKLREPFAEDEYETITYPVVFHVVQTSESVSGGSKLDASLIYEFFNTMVNAFERKVVFGPNSVDTRIRFRLAEYTPAGAKMQEKGINRFSMPAMGNDWYYFTEDFEGEIKGFQAKNLLWDYKKYLNIWIIEEATKGISKAATPTFILAGTEPLEGIVPAMQEKTEEEFETVDWSIYDIGMVFDIMQFATGEKLSWGQLGQVGLFFGLLPTEYMGNDKISSDYCEDTMPYDVYRESWYDNNGNDANNRLKITENGLLFYSTNIMDTYTFRNAITMDQMKRIRVITDNCPLRWAWKSKWAFTGKED